MSHERLTETQTGGERGSVLIVSLLIITLLTMIGGTFLILSGTEGNIATNQKMGVHALYLAESGFQAAYQEFAAAAFRGRTHEFDGSIATADLLVPRIFAPGEFVLDDLSDNGLANERNDGWLAWEWNPGDPGSGLTGTKMPESFRVSIRPTTADIDEDEWVFDIKGTVGQFNHGIRVTGTLEPLLGYSYFADGDLSDFSQDVTQQIYGRVHANGDIFFAPLGTRATFHTTSITAGGNMVRYEDAWGQPAMAGGEVRIQGASGIEEMIGGVMGVAMDSDNPDWANIDPTDGVDGALEIWGGQVRDGTLGTARVEVPSPETFRNGGSYDLSAAIRLRAGDVQVDQFGNDISAALGNVVKQVTFWNPGLEEYVTVQEVDMAQLLALNPVPTNGLIYSEVPIRLVNAGNLVRDLTVVANQSIYTRGDYNTHNKRAAALMTQGRIWHLSDSWQDDDAYTRGPVSGRQAAAGVTAVNAARVDGQPVVNEANFADIDDDGNPDQPGVGDAIANSEFLLESWGGGRTLKTRGSVIHLRSARMATNLDNNGIQAHEIPWLRHSPYVAPHRDTNFDNSLAGMSGQPPFWPMAFKIGLWEEIIF